MKKLQTKAGEILIVEVPENIDLDTLSYSTSQDLHLLTTDRKDVDVYCGNILDIKILGKLSELTDKDCDEFVEVTGGKLNNTGLEYRDYMSSEDSYNYYDNSKGSFISLLQSEGIDTSKELLIIKNL